MKRGARCGRLAVVAPFGLSKDLSGAFVAVGAAVADADNRARDVGQSCITTYNRHLSSDFFLAQPFAAYIALLSRSLKGRAGTRLTAAVEVEAELAKVFRGKDASVRR